MKILLATPCLLLIALFASLSLASTSHAKEANSTSPTLSYNQDVRPILSNNCFHCHGSDEESREADVRLDVSGSVDLEEMIARITSTDLEEKMPPADSNKQLSPEQIEILKRWIAAGAPYEEHWAFVPPQVHNVPICQDTKWSDQPIDRFVLARLERAGLLPKAKTDKRTLLRRVTFDLTGLPPTLDEIHAFLSDSSDKAYENLVDRLLAQPQYGEHMAKYWLDLVRFADTNGLHHDHYREMTPYRDWVIRAFNDNLGFDDFITDQIAGDLLEEPSIDQQIASGFNRLHLIIDAGTALPQESFTRNVVDRVSAVGTAFLGLTLQCAVCHDHKYDPITRQNFYELYAFFNNFDGAPETGGRRGLDFKRGLQPPYLELPTPAQAEERQQLEREIADLAAKIEALKAKPDDADALKALTDQLAQQQAARDALVTAIPATLVMKERAEVRPTHMLNRGVYDQPGDLVERNTPAFLPPMVEKEGPKTRLDLAKWLVAPSHPLTARVAVNRFWQQLFGVGLVKTSEDFGAQGEAPSHPQLLDHLALQFVQSGWNVKSLMRSIVLSQTYQQSSQASREEYVSDPGNRLLGRGSRFRIDAEMIRDQVLSVSGLLNPTMYGKSVKPPQPAGLWKIVAMPSSYPRVFQSDTGDQIYRRSVYTFWKRGLPPPQMTIFDAPSRESCIARRERTNTPLQALLLMNEEQYFAAARHYARTLLQQTDLNDEERIRQAYESITSQRPDDATLSELQNAREAFRQIYTADPASTQAMLGGSEDAELAAWTMLVHSLLNLDSTKTRE
ncbi:MAG: DUF1553 domain-containing protein [Planctomycetes bacterium]|nr:DUF1553 domain-containing protein [Planctomycetota bacterium]